jgi:hypothetical protein
MNRNYAALAAALAISLSGVVSAANVQSNGDVHAALAAQGYTDITNVERNGDAWSADARAAGNQYKLRVDPSTGYAYPDDADSNMSQMDVLAAIASSGYTNIGGLRFFGGVWLATATDATGKNVRIKVDPADGNVINESE